MFSSCVKKLRGFKSYHFKGSCNQTTSLHVVWLIFFCLSDKFRSSVNNRNLTSMSSLAVFHTERSLALMMLLTQNCLEQTYQVPTNQYAHHESKLQ